MKRIVGVTALCVAFGSLAFAAADPNAWTTSDFYIRSLDGTPLHTVLFRPANPSGPTPVILEVTPYLTSGATPLSPQDAAAEVSWSPGSLGSVGRIFEKNYSYAIVELRGYGASGGCYDFGGRGEQMDVIAAVKWAAGEEWSTGKVGMWGTSYPGGTQVMAMAAHNEGRLGEELAAVVPKSPPTGFLNLFTAYENPVRNTGGGHALPAFYMVSDLLPPSLLDTPEHHLTALGGTLADPLCYPDGVAGSYGDDVGSPYWVDHEIALRAAGSTVPALWVHGFNDFNVRTPNSLPVYTTLAGPHRGMFGPWDHGIDGADDATPFVVHAVRWYDRWVKGDESVDTGPPVLVQDRDGSWREETEWPPPAAAPHELPLRDATYFDMPGNFGETGLPAAVPIDAPVPLPGGNGTWTLTPRLTRDLRIAGVPRVTATVGSLVPDVHLVVLVYDVDRGNATFVARGATRVPASGEISFDLYPQDWEFAAGHRIGVLVTGADDLWFEPGLTLTPVTVRDATLSLPVLCEPGPAVADGPFSPRTEHPPIAVDPAGKIVKWTTPCAE